MPSPTRRARSSTWRSAISSPATSASRSARAGRRHAVNIGMLICNDRRWPEAWRVLGAAAGRAGHARLQHAGLNMENRGFEAHHLRVFHSHLSIQAGGYQNACFGPPASPRRAWRTGIELFGHSIIVNPQGEIMAQATTLGRRADPRRLRPGDVRARPQHHLQLRPPPPAGGLWPHHRPSRQRRAAHLDQRRAGLIPPGLMPLG